MKRRLLQLPLSEARERLLRLVDEWIANVDTPAGRLMREAMMREAGL